MSALYRRYRPSSFADLVGQEHIKQTLINSLKSDKVIHAYLFSGPRGVGKTSAARLLARGLNCLALTKQGEPCGTCVNCLEVINGQGIDIVEIDAASNRSIEDIRQLKQTISQSPVKFAYKVYIVDEVHMLTKEAFNALLKTLEEPPAHAVFILATTELHKVPETIMSRCVRLSFNRAQADPITSLLKKVAQGEKIKLTDEAALLISEVADGSFRDSLTILEALTNAGATIDEGLVLAQLGLPSRARVADLIDRLLAGQWQETLAIVRESLEKGEDLAALLQTALRQLRSDLFSQTEVQLEKLVLTEELLSVLAKARASSEQNSAITTGLALIASSREAVSPSKSTPRVLPVKPVIIDQAPVALPSDQEAKKPVEVALPQVDGVTQTEESEPAVDAVVAVAESVGEPNNKSPEAELFWARFLAEVKERNHALYAVIKSAHLESLESSKVVLAVRFRFWSERIYEPKNRDILHQVVTKVAGRPLAIECLVKPNDQWEEVSVKQDEQLMDNVVEVFEVA